MLDSVPVMLTRKAMLGTSRYANAFSKTRSHLSFTTTIALQKLDLL
ncbi:MAG: hypothetical protein F6K50_25215 [Moorea sp. SIO3I7]|nr:MULTISPECIES: hypothetical protein [unclassified Moorena]NEN98685.1 hypothetical protein [Moorena sp. SIO3I7]NEO07303.1 hypothetical protein [Moorena sp. SIO3I8]NEO22274.1 hypothetical protein [Moorena sp. SIO4A5]NEP25545.1 hypothetical protein [Moorena sp. SIO3I6]NEQ58794.1 hypothetical protein [Moorena sp. SIO4A1]